MMKRVFLGVLAGAFLAWPAMGEGFDAEFVYLDCTQNPEPVRAMVLWPVSLESSQPGGITTGDRRVFNTGTNGGVIVSNMLPGSYRGEFAGYFRVTTNYFTFPETNGLVQAKDFLSPGCLLGVPIYSQMQADLRFWGKGGLGPGTNVTYRTNAGKVFMDASAIAPDGGAGNNNTFTDPVIQGTLTLFPGLTLQNDGSDGLDLNGAALAAGSVTASLFTGNGSGLTGLPASGIGTNDGVGYGTLLSSLSVSNPVSGSLRIEGPAAGQWMWMASHGANSHDGSRVWEGVSLLFSSNGLSWSPATGAPMIYSPDQYTNNTKGPICREWATFFYNNHWYAADNYDPYNVGGRSQGIELWDSYDLTNWCRLAVLYPFGITNAQGCMFGPTWFQDDDASVWITFPYGTNGFNNQLKAWSIKATDASLLNWTAPNLIHDVLNSPDDGSVFAYDVVVVKAAGVYKMFYKDNDGFGYEILATNNAMNTVFKNKNIDDFMNVSGNSYETITPIHLSGSHWRAYGRQFTIATQSGGYATNQMDYTESLDDCESWSAWTNMTGTGTAWYGPGMHIIPAQTQNKPIILGTNYGQVIIGNDLVVAKALNADQLQIRQGLSASNIISDRAVHRVANVDSLIAGGQTAGVGLRIMSAPPGLTASITNIFEIKPYENVPGALPPDIWVDSNRVMHLPPGRLLADGASVSNLNLAIARTNTAPANTSTVRFWIGVTNADGTVGRIPAYQ